MRAEVMEDALLLAWFNRAYYKERKPLMETYPRINEALEARLAAILERHSEGEPE